MSTTTYNPYQCPTCGLAVETCDGLQTYPQTRWEPAEYGCLNPGDEFPILQHENPDGEICATGKGEDAPDHLCQACYASVADAWDEADAAYDAWQDSMRDSGDRDYWDWEVTESAR